MAEDRKGGLGLLLAMGPKARGGEAEPDPADPAEPEGEQETSEAEAVAASDVRDALNGNDDAALARALARFVHVMR